MSKDKQLRDWSTWVVRAILMAGITYAGWWIRGVNVSLSTLQADVAYIRGSMAEKGGR